MSLPASLTARMREDLFWAQVLYEEVDQELGFAVDVGGDYRFGTQILLGGRSQSLEIYAPGSAAGKTVGRVEWWDSRSPALRWEELELICRAAALLDPDIRHPGPVAALLVPYLLRDGSESLDAISPVLDAAFRLARPRPGDGLRPETRTLLDTPLAPGITWVDRADGYRAVTVQGDPTSDHLQSPRSPTSEDFPFALLSELLAAATATVAAVAAATCLRNPAVRSTLDTAIHDQDPAPLADALRNAGYDDAVILRALESPTDPVETAWVLEALSAAPQGSIIARWFGASPLHHLRRWDLTLRLAAAREVDLYTPSIMIKVHVEQLVPSAVLTFDLAHDRQRSGEPAEMGLSVVVRDDLPAALAAIRESLAQGFPGVTASLWNGAEEISLTSER
ncbi:hypothetical protein [Pseudofrankia saprophytica]|uniref:hypothetical protein n=1 Tax=Pseudofrankia saprophytica TaxID=298655 RepID=UPI0003111AB5|nr:hypothetical protein [Pseudofrankia saprophytica]